MATKPTEHQPWTKVIRFDQSTLNTSQDGADINDNQLQTCQNFIFDNGVLEKSGGLTKVNSSPEESGTRILGVFRSHDTYGNKALLAMVNGKLKRWTGSAFADIETGLSTSARPDFLNWKDRTIMVNGVNEARAFSPRTNGIKKFGVEPPRFYKKVAYFESDETITHVNNSATDTTFIKTIERTGKSKTSLKLTSTTIDLSTAYITYSPAQNFGLFPNGVTLGGNDTLCVDIWHGIRANITEIYIDFWTSTGNYYRATIQKAELDPINERDNRWTTIELRRSLFVATGNPSWTNINRVYFQSKGVDGGEVVIYIDNVYFKNSPIQGSSFAGSLMSGFESSGTGGTPDGDMGSATDWDIHAGYGGSMVRISDPEYVKNGKGSLKMIPAVLGPNILCGIYKQPSGYWNLNLHMDGSASPASDEIVLVTKAHWDSTLGIKNLAIIFRMTAGRTCTKTWITGTDFKNTTGEVWKELRCKKSDFTYAGAGSADWSIIDYITIFISSSSTSKYVYLDNFYLEKVQYTRSLSDMESDETWTISGTGGTNADKDHLSEGIQSVYLQVAKGQTATATRNIAATDLTIFNAANELSTTEDYITLWCQWTVFNNIDNIKLLIDCNLDDYTTDYFEYEWTKDGIRLALEKAGLDFSDLNNKAIELKMKKTDFTRIGATSGKGWDTVQGYRISLTSTSNAENDLIVYFDNMWMKVVGGISGLYQWCCVFESSEGYLSAPSEWSNITECFGNKVSLRYIPISADSDILARHLYRRGGSWGDEARLVTTFYDNTKKFYSDNTPDDVLSGSRPLTGSDIPDGTIRVPLAGKWGPIFKNRAILYRDPEDYKRVWYSNATYLNAWSELNLIMMDSDVQNIFLEDGILYLNCKNGMRRISIPLNEITPDDIEQVGDVKPVISPWASIKAEQFTALVAYDGPYLFNGQSMEYIGELVDTYFDEAVYDLDEAILFYLDRHLYISVKTIAGVRTLLDAYGPPIQWGTSNADINCFCIFDGIGDNGEIYIGDSTGTVWVFNSGYATTGIATLKDFNAEGEESDVFNNIVLTNIHILAKSKSSTPGPIAITLRKDQADVAGITLYASSDKTITGDLASVYTLYSFDLRGIYDEQRGATVGIKLTHSSAKHCAIKSVKLEGEITPLSSDYE